MICLLDFYVKGTLNLNYDNQPAVKGNDLDYVFSTGLVGSCKKKPLHK